MSKLVENYLLEEAVGKGVYGTVYRAIHQKSKQQYAVKVIKKAVFQANPKLEQLAINEIKILSSLKNEHIVRFIQTLKTPNNFYFVYEYCNEGTLEGLMQKKKILAENEALSYLAQLLDAFKELNKNNVMHRDLKPDNIFLSNGKIKLGDFGFCKTLQVNMAQTMLGSPIYMAPEILRQQIYTSKADIWSLGVVLYQMLFGFCPYQSNSISQLINVLKQNELKIPDGINPISSSTKDLIQKMLVKDQFKRIQWVDLFQYRTDEDGKFTCPVKKDYSSIQMLQNYFLYNKTSSTPPFTSEKEIKNDSETLQPQNFSNKFQKGQQKADRVSHSNTAKPAKELQQMQTKPFNVGTTNLNSKPSTNVMNMTPQPPNYGQNNVSNNQSPVSGFRNLNQCTNVSQASTLAGSQNKNTTDSGVRYAMSTNNLISQPSEQQLYGELELKHTYSATGASDPSFGQQKRVSINRRNSPDFAFDNIHEQWIRGLQLMAQLSAYPKEASEIFIYWMLVSLNKKVNAQAFYHPKYTSFLLSQRRAISQSLKEMEGLDTRFKNPLTHPNISPEDGKNDIYKLWRKNCHSEIKESLFEEAIKFMYGSQHNAEFSTDQILLT